ncbi:telomere stability and silencing-domain-containing protein [Geopyxis carbonaria]|nr:telomere stability and silencing-domain-containing protein [Geopyxis carbonaria]
MAEIINTHITTFSGLPNVNLRLPASTTFDDLYTALHEALPPTSTPLRLSTTSGHNVFPSATTPIGSLTSSPLLTLRATIPLCGGKGGFGSQLRAAGGRMSSRKKSQENSDSCRNLDGRRMRTVKEAKALAAYLEVKPEMEKKEREARMKRWREVVEAAERREEGSEKKRFDDVEWVEGVEEGRERTREAVMAALKNGLVLTKMEAEGSSGESSGAASEEEDGGEPAEKKKEMPTKPVRTFAGWDDEDAEFMSSDEEMDDIVEEDEEEEEVRGKGKGKAVA